MADEKEGSNPEEETEQPDEASGSAAAGSRKLKLGLALLVLLLAAGAGYWFLMPSETETGEVAEEEAVPVMEEAHYLELEPAFVINLPDRGRQRFLQATITIMSRNRAAILTADTHMPAIRHNLSRVLSAQSIETIQSPGGIEQVREEAKVELNKILLDEYGSEAIEEVLFTAFVMQ